MAGFTPFKRHANKFKYNPRYYDPIKEELEQRRMELRGERRDQNKTQDEEGYIPGQYLRNKQMARQQRRHESMQGGRRKVWMSVAIAVMIFVMGLMILPRIITAFTPSSSSAEERALKEIEEFNPYRPIKVVPNDYKE